MHATLAFVFSGIIDNNKQFKNVLPDIMTYMLNR